MPIINYIKEYRKCALNIQYFVEHYVDISCSSQSTTRLDPKKHLFLHQSTDYERIITVHERGAGCSLTLCIILLHKIMFNSNFQIALMSHDLNMSMGMLDHVREMHDALPPFLQQLIAYNRKKLFMLSNGSKINVVSANENSCRGMTLNFICIDNAALIPNLGGICINLHSRSDYRCIIASNPLSGSHFDDLVHHSALQRTQCKLIYFPSR